NRRVHLGQAEGEVRREGETDRRRSDAHLRAHHHAQHHRRAVEGSLAGARSLEAGHWLGRLRAEGSAGRIQERELRYVPGDARSHRYTDDPAAFNLPVVAEETAGGISRRRTGARPRW